MSTNDAMAFVERLRTDESFLRQLAAAATPEERRQLASEAGYELSPDDVDTIRVAMGVQELSDADLESVAGGFDELEAISIGGLISIGVAVAASYI